MLSRHGTQLLDALLKHDVSGLPVADTLRVTEDAVEKPLAKVGLVGTVTRLRGFRQDIIDERAGVAGAHVVVEETGAPVLLVVRLKVVADKLTEIELVATRSRAEGLIFNIDGLSTPSAVMNYAPRPEQLATRDAAITAALNTRKGRVPAKTFAAVNAPLPQRLSFENGQLMAGPTAICPRARTLDPVARDLRASRDPAAASLPLRARHVCAHGLGRAKGGGDQLNSCGRRSRLHARFTPGRRLADSACWKATAVGV